jgi:hypothetical protein
MADNYSRYTTTELLHMLNMNEEPSSQIEYINNFILDTEGNLYFGFDMDATIGFVHQFYDIIQTYPQGTPLYNKIISFIAKKEKENPLVFNPLIVSTLNIIAKINKRNKRIYCMIYSNHGDLKMVQFASDVLEKIIGEKLFCAHVHYGHYIRNEFDKILNKNRFKTWNTFKKIFTELCYTPDPTPEKCVFFDDQNHDDLKQTLRDNYIQVTPYNEPCSYFPELEQIALSRGGRKLNTQKKRKNRKNGKNGKNFKKTVKTVKTVKSKL